MSGYRNRTQWTTATDNELLEKFRQLSTQTRIPASRLLDEAIEDLLVKYAVMTKEEKKQVISYLDQKGAMLITKSGPKICRYLGISKFTLYNYLDEIHSEQEQKTKQYP